MVRKGLNAAKSKAQQLPAIGPIPATVLATDRSNEGDLHREYERPPQNDVHLCRETPFFRV